MEPCCCPMCCQPLRANHECGTCAICNQDHPGDQCLDSTIIGRCRGCGQKHAGNACPCPRCLAFHHGDNCYPLFTTGGNHHIVEAFTSTTGFCGLCGHIHDAAVACPCHRCHQSHPNDDCLQQLSGSEVQRVYIVPETVCQQCHCWHGTEVCPQALFPLGVTDVPVEGLTAAFFNRAMQLNTNVNDEAIGRHNLGAMTNVCPHCKAKFWCGETINCCYAGSLLLPEVDIPDDLQKLILSATVRENIRMYNMAMAMASVGHSNETLVGGIFVMAGKSYHRIGSLLPRAGNAANYAQIYTLDCENATARRQEIFKNQLKKDALRRLHDLLSVHNSYVSEFRKAAASDVPVLTWSSNDDIMGMHVGALVAAPGRSRCIVIQRHGNAALTYINDCHPLYHTLTYPLLFPTGATGWHYNMRRWDQKTLTDRKVTLTDYGRYMLMHRDHPTHVQQCERLAVEFYCDAWAQQEARSAMFHSSPVQQSRYRVGRKCAVDDQLHNDGDLCDASVPMILPSSFVGSSKWYHMLYLDALTLPSRFHAPDLFITFTCNRKWPEIVNALPSKSQWVNHPDIIARVFWLKLKALMADIVEHQVFGRVEAYVWRIEWQARGLPHAHILIILATPLRDAHQIDKVVSAEIPDPEQHPELHALVQELMIHTPCDDDTEAGCRQQNKKKDSNDTSHLQQQKTGSCKRHFPKMMSNKTVLMPNQYPMYRRRGRYTCTVKGRIVSDDWVVPHSPFLLLRYGAHINVEIAAFIKSFKYVYKYVLKPPDNAAIAINEIEAHLSGRLLSASEAVWRFLGLPLHKEFPPVMRLHIHLPNEHSVVFDPTADADQIGDASQSSTSTLLQWFALNASDSTAQSLLYKEVPEHYTWNTKSKVWNKRQHNGFSLGRMYSVSSRNQELFALKRLLSVVRGAKDWKDLLTVDNHCYETFQQACGARGMLQDDSDVIEAFQDFARHSCSVDNLRREFAIILLNRTCQNALLFFNLFASNLCADENVTPHNVAVALWAIESEMQEHGRSLEDKDFGFKLPNRPVGENQILAVCWRHHIFSHVECCTQRDHYVQMFTDEQRTAMQAIVDAVEGRSNSNVFTVLASAGCGKTCFVSGVTWHLRAQQRIIVNIAASALAATLLPGGRTAHSALHIPIPTNSFSFCGLKSSERNLIQQCSVIFYDEVSMVSQEVADCIDRSLREIMSEPKLPFGGKIVCFLGDFKQLLPVVPGRSNQITIKNCEWWNLCRVFRFTKNWRAAQNPEFARLLEDVGNGKMASVPVPPQSQVQTIQLLIEKVYGSEMAQVPQSNNMILALKLDACSQINEICLKALPGEGMDVSALDDLKDNKNPDQYPAEYLASLPLNGVPPASLTLKVHGRYMITKNYDTHRGACNGTLCEMLQYTRHAVQVRLLTGTQKGRVMKIPRCSSHVSQENSGLPFCFTRIQFPLIPAYCVSVHKSQGQTIHKVGLFITQDCFAHGQL